MMAVLLAETDWTEEIFCHAVGGERAYPTAAIQCFPSLVKT
jgi:hypothetical protein